MNTGSSPYHSIGALFCRGSHGDLLSVEGGSADLIAQNWAELRKVLATSTNITNTLPSGTQINTTTVEASHSESLRICATSSSHSHVVRELYRPSEGCHVGLVRCNIAEVVEDFNAFREWLEIFILLETSLKPSNSTLRIEDTKAHQTTESITSIFAATLKNVASNDEWATGINLFKRRVEDFVIRNERIQMALPAFPCKSPSSRKVGTHTPDMAELIALRTLHRFSQAVKAIYPPGVAIWIVSDGYVFSDCIGVDDSIVSSYDKKLLEMYQAAFTSADDHEAIRFRGLNEMFFSNSDAQASFDHDWCRLFNLDHPVHSERSPQAELARNIMMTGFQSSREHFRKLVAEQHPPTLSLYRGQARFMQDDLSNPAFQAMSSKQKKKLSFSVAAEMIARNQAYSNLLELLLPNFVRLSIHAHTNRGPKFGICLFPRTAVHAIDSIVDRHALCPSYEFQVPTPWHNSIIKVEGDDMTYLGKAEIVHKAIENGDFDGGWVEDDIEGGHFMLRQRFSVCNGPSTAAESTSTVYIDYADKQAGMANGNAIEIVASDSSREVTKMRLSLRLRGKVYRIFELTRLLGKRVTRDRSGLQTGGSVAEVSAQ